MIRLLLPDDAYFIISARLSNALLKNDTIITSIAKPIGFGN